MRYVFFRAPGYLGDLVQRVVFDPLAQFFEAVAVLLYELFVVKFFIDDDPHPTERHRCVCARTQG